MRENYYGARALAGLRELGEVVLHDGLEPLGTAALIAAAAGCQIIVADRATRLRGGPVRRVARPRRRLARRRRYPQHRCRECIGARRPRHAGQPQLGGGGERAGDRPHDRRRTRHLARRHRLQGRPGPAGRQGPPARRLDGRHHRLRSPRPPRLRPRLGLRHERAGERSLRRGRARRDRAGGARRAAQALRFRAAAGGGDGGDREPDRRGAAAADAAATRSWSTSRAAT